MLLIRLLGALVIGGCVQGVRAQADPTGPGESRPSVRVDEIDITTTTLLARADQLLALRQWDEAIETWRRAMDVEGDRLIRLPVDWGGDALFPRFVPVRHYIQARLTALHASQPAALRSYRARLNPLAERWFREGQEQRDRAAWQRVVEHSFLSQWADDALLALGDDALERRHFTAARSAWERLLPRIRATPTSPDPVANWWAYPDTDLPLADIEARLVMVSILEGSPQRAKRELERFQQQHAASVGQISGQRGPWVDLLQQLLERAPTWPEPDESRDWPTFGGDFTRGRASRREIDPTGRPRWSVSLPRVAPAAESDSTDVAREGEPRGQLLPYHPVVVGSYVVIAAPNGVYAWQRDTGLPALGSQATAARRDGRIFESSETQGAALAPAGRVSGQPRYTLSALGQHVFAKVGPPWLVGGERLPGQVERGAAAAIIGLNLEAEGKTVLRLDSGISFSDSDREDLPWTWEGPPICSDGQLYVGCRRSDGLQTQVYVACFDARSGRLRWRRMVAAADMARIRPINEWTSNLLTLHEDTLYYNTNLGVVAALDARDGALRWLTGYPQAVLGAGPSGRRRAARDLTPCLVHRGLVFVAPSDSPRVFALEATTGQLVWTTDEERGEGIAQLLGVGEDRLIAGGDALYWLDVATGRPRGQFPPSSTGARRAPRPNPSGRGRGLLAGGHVWWPVHDRILVFDQRTEPAAPGWRPIGVREIELRERGAQAGNLVLVDGMLFIAGTDTLYAFQEP